MTRREWIIRAALTVLLGSAIPVFAISATTWPIVGEVAIAVFFIVAFGIMGWSGAAIIRGTKGER